jgi:hypothetical protein
MTGLINPNLGVLNTNHLTWSPSRDSCPSWLSALSLARLWVCEEWNWNCAPKKSPSRGWTITDNYVSTRELRFFPLFRLFAFRLAFLFCRYCSFGKYCKNMQSARPREGQTVCLMAYTEISNLTVQGARWRVEFALENRNEMLHRLSLLQ